MPDNSGFVWAPSEDQISHSNLHRMLVRHGLKDYQGLWRKSTEDLEWFWTTVIGDLGLQFATPYKQLLDTSKGVPWSRWCSGGEINISVSCVDRWAEGANASRLAVRWEGEEGSSRTLSYGELHREVLWLAASLRRIGLKKGDAIAIFMPMTPEVVVAVLAIARIGAIMLPLFSGYGPEPVSARLSSSGAKALITADGFYRRGKLVAVKEVADQAALGAETLQTMIVFRRTGTAVNMVKGRDLWWHELRAAALEPRGVQDSSLEVTDAEDPLMLIYTSGTTGSPKGAVHTHCGFPVKAAQDMLHCFDVQQSDTIFWITDLGWMMGPWLIYGGLLLGATIVLYDGALDFPGPGRLWSLVERYGVSVLGISPSLVRGLMPHGDASVRHHDLRSLRVLGSTGEPWNDDPWRWLFQTVGGGRLPIINYSGGTEISGGILGGNLLLPMKPSAFSAPILGMTADVLDSAGNSVRGESGELVIRRPWIGMTRGFWNAPERYIETYWSRFPGVWTHGDWAIVDADGCWYIPGRSDDTIKVAGKRLGPAEVESVLVAHEAVIEAACVGVPDPLKGQDVVCFCVLSPKFIAGPDLAEQLREHVSQSLGKALKPRQVILVQDLPRTRNAKLMRRVLRAVYLGEPAGDLSSLENPQALEEISRAAGRERSTR